MTGILRTYGHDFCPSEQNKDEMVCVNGECDWVIPYTVDPNELQKVVQKMGIDKGLSRAGTKCKYSKKAKKKREKKLTAEEQYETNLRAVLMDPTPDNLERLLLNSPFRRMGLTHELVRAISADVINETALYRFVKEGEKNC